MAPNLSLAVPCTSINGNNNNVLTNSVQNNNTNNIQININCYGNENVDYVTDEFKDARLRELNGKEILKYIQHVHFNQDYPENHNIQKHNKTLCKVYDEGQWSLHSMKLILGDLPQLPRQTVPTSV